ncbi:MAG TPA: VUT family protein [Gemmataceae bacterium]|nr:VUT family protein [Gemmataceae bacterium]
MSNKSNLSGVVRLRGALCFAGLLACVVAANVTLNHFGLWAIGPFLVASGAIWAGLALTLRDGIHETIGARWVLLAIVCGAALSAVVDPSLAVASGVAFLLGELFDFAVYAPLRQRGRLRAVALSNVAGAIVDSYVFLELAPFGPVTLNAVAGLVLAKVVVTAVTVAALAAWRAR